MLFSEFEKLMGCRVTMEEYNAANAVYMALSWDKEKFCGWYKKNRKSEIFTEIWNLVCYTSDQLRARYDEIKSLKQSERSRAVIIKTLRDAIPKIAVTYSEWGQIEIEVSKRKWKRFDTSYNLVEWGEFVTSKNDPDKVLSITRTDNWGCVTLLSPKVTNAFKLIGFRF